MASEPSTITHPVIFTTQSPYPLPTQKFMIPASWKRFQLSQLVNKALSLVKPIPFDFIVRGELLRGSLGEWCAENGVGEEETLEIEYIQSVLPPQKISEQPHEDWVSSVSCQIRGHLLTASYDGSLRAFDYSKSSLVTHQAHNAPITSLCVVSSGDDDSHLIATSSHDLSAQLTRLHLSPEGSTATPLASLHLHTGPISSISTNSSGTHLLTASWDALIGVFDTTIPDTDQVPLEQIDGERKKRRKVEANGSNGRGRRKGPVSVMKSHTARISKALFIDGDNAASCGFDSTIRLWDVESAVCTSTITASERPFLDMASNSPHTVVASSTDRTVSQYDLRADSTTSTVSFLHPCTPSCVAISPADSSGLRQVMSGGYDGIVRVWDLRSTKTAVTTFKAWDDSADSKKVLGVDWINGLVGVGGEGGLCVWRIGEEVR